MLTARFSLPCSGWTPQESRSTLLLASELADKFESVGGYEALNDLLNGSMERPNLSSWVDIIRDAAKRRHLAIVCQDLLNQLDEPATNTNELLDQAE